MKHLLTILCILTSFSALAQFPNTHTQSNPYTKEIFNGSVNPKKGVINGRYSDTAAANRDYVAGEKGIQIVVGNTIYMRDSTATKWIVAGGYGVTASNITILNDSSISVCNTNSCDTFKFTNIVVNNFTVVNDSTILVCDGNNTCDTLFIPPTPIAKPYVDSAKIIGGTLYYYINGNAYPSGDVLGRTDGLISPGIVTWAHDSTFFVSSATYIINGKQYISPSDSVTISGIDPSLPTKFLFIVDTLSRATYLRGVPATIPLDPQVDPSSQIALTSGITFDAGATQPENINQITIYDEYLGAPDEWAVSSTGTISVNFSSTTTPYHLTKDINVSSFNKNSALSFLGVSNETVLDGEILRFFINLKAPFTGSKGLRIQFFNGSTAASNAVSIYNTFGLNPSILNSYQNVSIPLNAFIWSSQTFNKIVVTNVNSGTGYLLDYVQLQTGINNIPSQTDYSNKLDSVTIKKITIGSDTANIAVNWIKGVSYPSKDTIWTGGSSSGSGTVTNFSFTNTTGITGTVTNPTTTPNLSLAIDTSALPGVHTTNFNDTRYALISTLVGNYVKYTDTASMLSPYMLKGTKNPLNVIRPILAADSVTIGFDTIHLPELRYSLTLRDTTKWTDTTLIDKKYFKDRIDPIIAAVNTNTTNIAANTTAIAGKLSNITGLVTAGTNVTVTGSGTGGSPYVVSSTGGGSGGTPIDTVATITALENTATATRYVYVADSLRGGFFTYISTGLTPDSGTVFNANGKSGGYWKRNFVGAYKPEWFGAKGDGSTNDATAIQLMNNAMPLRGGKVSVGARVYIINSQVTIDRAIWFEGNGMSNSTSGSIANRPSTFETTGSNVVMFRVISDQVKFSDLFFYESGTHTSGCAIRADSNALNTTGVMGVRVDRCGFTGFFNQLEFTGTHVFGVTNSTFLYMHNYGIVVANPGSPDAGDSYITGCDFEANTGAIAAIYQITSGGLRITNNKINKGGTFFQYGYLADSINNTADLLIGFNSIENTTVSAIKIKSVPQNSFSQIIINSNQFGQYNFNTRPTIQIQDTRTISIVGNSFQKGNDNDTAILLTNVSDVNINNTYSTSIGHPVVYLGTNSNNYGDGAGVKYALPKWNGATYQSNSSVEDSSSVIGMQLRSISNNGYVPNYINSTTGNGKLSIANNVLTGGALDIGLINSNIAGGGFSLWQQNSATTSQLLLRMKANGNVGFGVSNPLAYVDIPAGTGTANTGQIHLGKGVVTNSDGYLSYDTSIIPGRGHLYFNINGTQQRLDSQVTSSSGAVLANGTVPLTANWNVGNFNITGVTTLNATTVGATSVTANTTVSANGNITTGGLLGATQYNFGTGETTGLSLTNGQPATSGTTVQNSLMELWQGSVWNGSSANTVHYRAGVYPIAGTNTSEWKLRTNLDAGTYSDVLKVKSDGRVTLSNVINLKAYTVATLPTGTVGDVAYVTDATAPTYLGTLTGGGSVVCPVFFNGVSWVSH